MVRITDAQVNEQILHLLLRQTAVIDRPVMAGLVAAGVRRTLGTREFKASSPRAAEMHNEGRALFGRLLDRRQIDEILAWFASRPCYNSHRRAHSDQVARHIGEGAEKFHYGAYADLDTVLAPHLLELANTPEILAVAEDYLGCTPTLYSLNAWWSFSGMGKAKDSQEFHRDLDDFRFCTLFVYLTDVDTSTGAHIFIRRSHAPQMSAAVLQEAIRRQPGIKSSLQDLYGGDDGGYGRDDVYRRVFDGYLETIEGPAGTAFLADTSGLHMGIPLVTGKRLMFWARYGLYSNPTVKFAANLPIDGARVAGRLPVNARMAYINRCLVTL